MPAAIIGRFRSLSLQRLERVEAGWTTLIQHDGDIALAAEVQQDLHTLKGDSRVVGFNDIHLLSHKLEELLSVAHRRGYEVPEEFDLVVTMAVRLMMMLLRTRDGASLGGIDVDGFVQQIDELLAENPVSLIAATSEAGPLSRRSIVQMEPLDHVSPRTQQRLAAVATEVFLQQLRSAGDARARLLEVWGALSRQISEFYAVPLGPQLARHQQAALVLARDLGKEVTVELATGDVRVRADAADALDTALLHLLRNAVDHGVEAPEARERAGKPPAGRIRVHLRVVNDGGEVVVEDDGRGVDLEEVRRRGVALEYMTPSEAERAGEPELLDLLLRPGFSTRVRVSDVSGRGIGLDAIRTALARVGGRITLSSRLGQGMTAVARVPQASRRLKVQCFHARGASLVLAVPATYKVTSRLERPLDPSAPARRGRAPFDPLEALDVVPGEPREEARGAGGEGGDRLIVIERDGFEVTLRAGGEPHPRTAERFCPTGDDYPAEVVLLGDMEALLLRPELLGALGGAGRR